MPTTFRRLGPVIGLTVAAAAAVAALLAPPTAAAASSDPATLRPDGRPTVGGLAVLSGSLHDHSTDSDGDAADSDVAAWEAAHHAELGIDFGSLTDHSDFFPATYSSPGADPWSHQAAVDQQYTSSDFAFLRGFEWTNDQENHLNVLGSQDWTSRFTTGDASLHMAPFWTWLATAPAPDPTGTGVGLGGADGIGQFNHPDSKGALNWDDYAYDAAAAGVMATIEIHGDQGKGGLDSSDAGWYWFALSQGWTVSPVMNWDWHDWHADRVLEQASPGADCGVTGFLPCQRSLVIAADDRPESIYAALRARRTSASERPDLWATLRGPDDTWQGSTVTAQPGQTITLTVDAGSSSADLTSVDIVSDAGVSPYPYYYGDNVTCDTSGCDPTEFEHSQLTPSYVEQHRRYVASGGHATKKQRLDSPPPGTVIATVPLSGHRDEQTITVAVPTAASTRPDGKHFFYAIAHAGPARAWTGPVLTTDEPGPQLPEVPYAVLLPLVGALAATGAFAIRRRLPYLRV